MAQTLKEELRIRIINASREEFLEKGYKEASMRSIAVKAGMTVGNLYRYFESKEDIMAKITESCAKELKACFSSMPNLEDTQEIRVYNIGYDVECFRKQMDSLSQDLSEVFGRYPFEFNILFSDEETKNDVVYWFFELIKKIINANYRVDGYQSSVQIIAMSYAESIYEGINVIFSVKNMKKEKAETLLKIYLRGYASILDADVSKLVTK